MKKIFFNKFIFVRNTTQVKDKNNFLLTDNYFTPNKSKYYQTYNNTGTQNYN